MKSKAPAIWDEAELLEVSMLTDARHRRRRALGVTPRQMAAVLDAP